MDSRITQRYDIVIGLESHVQVRTRSKMFCACPNRYGEAPNTLVCPVCLGYPGVLPTPNRTAIHKTLVAGLMIGSRLPRFSKFDRKSYFYPDMPKNYQITQYDQPFCDGGRLPVGGKALDGEVAPRSIGITRIHLEEDVAKSTHFGPCTGIDFNRAGVPLMEIVSEPDMHSPDEAYLYLLALKQLMQYADISDCDMEKGQMRCDVNVSLKPAGSPHFLPKTEVKNLNSFKAVHRALHYEIERQAEVLDQGGKLQQQTRGWDDNAGSTYVMRSKEFAHDYRYFPDPDLMPIEIGPEWLAAVQAAMPELPWVRRERFATAYGLGAYDAQVLTQEQDLASYFEASVKAGANPKRAANWIMSELLKELATAGQGIAACKVSPEQLASLLGLMEQSRLNNLAAKQVFADLFQTGRDPEVVMKEKGLEQVSDSSELEGFVRQALAANPKAVEEYRAGQPKALNFLIGQTMRLSRGKANPQLVTELIRRALEQ